MLLSAIERLLVALPSSSPLVVDALSSQSLPPLSLFPVAPICNSSVSGRRVSGLTASVVPAGALRAVGPAPNAVLTEIDDPKSQPVQFALSAASPEGISFRVCIPRRAGALNSIRIEIPRSFEASDVIVTLEPAAVAQRSRTLLSARGSELPEIFTISIDPPTLTLAVILTLCGAGTGNISRRTVGLRRMEIFQVNTEKEVAQRKVAATASKNHTLLLSTVTASLNAGDLSGACRGAAAGGSAPLVLLAIKKALASPSRQLSTAETAAGIELFHALKRAAHGTAARAADGPLPLPPTRIVDTLCPSAIWYTDWTGAPRGIDVRGALCVSQSDSAAAIVAPFGAPKNATSSNEVRGFSCGRASWNFLIVEEQRRGHQSTCLGAATMPLIDPCYSSSPQLAMVRAWNGHRYEWGSSSLGGVGGGSHGVSSFVFEKGDVVGFEADWDSNGGSGSVRMSINGVDRGVVFDNIAGKELFPAVAFYGSDKRSVRLLSVTASQEALEGAGEDIVIKNADGDDDDDDNVTSKISLVEKLAIQIPTAASSHVAKYTGAGAGEGDTDDATGGMLLSRHNNTSVLSSLPITDASVLYYPTPPPPIRSGGGDSLHDTLQEKRQSRQQQQPLLPSQNLVTMEPPTAPEIFLLREKGDVLYGNFESNKSIRMNLLNNGWVKSAAKALRDKVSGGGSGGDGYDFSDESDDESFAATAAASSSTSSLSLSCEAELNAALNAESYYLFSDTAWAVWNLHGQVGALRGTVTLAQNSSPAIFQIYVDGEMVWELKVLPPSSSSSPSPSSSSTFNGPSSNTSSSSGNIGLSRDGGAPEIATTTTPTTSSLLSNSSTSSSSSNVPSPSLHHHTNTSYDICLAGARTLRLVVRSLPNAPEGTLPPKGAWIDAVLVPPQQALCRVCAARRGPREFACISCGEPARRRHSTNMTEVVSSSSLSTDHENYANSASYAIVDTYGLAAKLCKGLAMVARTILRVALNKLENSTGFSALPSPPFALIDDGSVGSIGAGESPLSILASVIEASITSVININNPDDDNNNNTAIFFAVSELCHTAADSLELSNPVTELDSMCASRLVTAVTTMVSSSSTSKVYDMITKSAEAVKESIAPHTIGGAASQAATRALSMSPPSIIAGAVELSAVLLPISENGGGKGDAGGTFLLAMQMAAKSLNLRSALLSDPSSASSRVTLVVELPDASSAMNFCGKVLPATLTRVGLEMNSDELYATAPCRLMRDRVRPRASECDGIVAVYFYAGYAPPIAFDTIVEQIMRRRR